jgi:hypothetical protein
MMPRTPRAPQSSIMRTTTRAGTTNTTRSTPFGSSLIDDRHARPHTVSYLGLIGYRSPSNPRWCRDRAISGAQESGDSEAPTIAIERGASRGVRS